MISKLAEKACDLRFSPCYNLLKGAVHRHELPGPLRGAGENHDLYLQLIFLIVPNLYLHLCYYLYCVCILYLYLYLYLVFYLFVFESSFQGAPVPTEPLVFNKFPSCEYHINIKNSQPTNQHFNHPACPLNIPALAVLSWALL